jgi:hypothetical protein
MEESRAWETRSTVVVKKLPTFIELEYLLPRSHKLANGSCPEMDESHPHNK